MRPMPATLGVLLFLAAPAVAQQPGPNAIDYDISFDNAVHHEARISVTYRNIGKAPLRLQMSRSSPGRYAIHEFAKNVYSVSAKDGRGRALKVGRTDPYGWTVAGHDGTVTVSYTLYADRGDGTYSQIDASHAHLNMPATFMWAQGLESRPIRIRFRPLHPSWKVATQLPKGSGANMHWAPNLQYFMDSPTEISDHQVEEWPVDDQGRRYTIRLVVHHDGSREDVERYAAMAQKVVREQIKVFGDVPNFDYGTYTFIADYLPHVTGDGMEHRNSTYITDDQSLKAANFSQLQTLSHEFFHAWNVERLRPAELEPFDFTRANPTPSLWFAEGFTTYYGPLTICRTGEISLDDCLASFSSTLSSILNAPGRRYGSPEEMSLRAPFVDAATSIDPVNTNIFVSYYPYGAVIGMALDLTLRQRFGRLTLDDYMRHLWKRHGVPEKPFTPDDLRQGLAELTGDAAFANDFFARSIKGSELPDFAPLLAQAGLTLRAKNKNVGWAGPAAFVADSGVTLSHDTAPGTPLYQAGLSRGDVILSAGGTPIASAADWTKALAGRKPGENVEIRFVQRGTERRAQLKLAADPALEIVRNEAIGLPLTPAQTAFRAAWLGTAAR